MTTTDTPADILTGLRALATEYDERYAIIEAFIESQLKEKIDYGTIPLNSGGTKLSKPTLFKPGAEKLCVMLRLRPKFYPDLDVRNMAGNPNGLFAYVCRLYDTTGRCVGEGRGAASLGERSGWTVNNAIKVCEKRAQVNAILRVAGLSSKFEDEDTADTQDTRTTQANQEGSTRPAAQSATNTRPTGNPSNNNNPRPQPARSAATPTDAVPQSDRPITPAVEYAPPAMLRELRTLAREVKGWDDAKLVAAIGRRGTPITELIFLPAPIGHELILGFRETRKKQQEAAT